MKLVESNEQNRFDGTQGVERKSFESMIKII